MPMRIAVLQMTADISPDVNLATVTDAIGAASAAGAVMLFTPEMTNLVDQNRERSAPHIDSEGHSRFVAAVRDAAAAAGLWVHLGSVAVTDEANGGKRRNRGLVIADDGAIRARYDKIHLYDADLPTGESWRESAAMTPGDQAVCCDTPIGRLGLSICYDIRFPALYQALSHGGATALAIPAAFTVPTGAAHWSTLIRARAIENACFVIAAAQAGVHADGRSTYGHSMVVGPWGDVLLELDDMPGLHVVELDLAEVDRVRARIPVIAHRRPIASGESR